MAHSQIDFVPFLTFEAPQRGKPSLCPSFDPIVADGLSDVRWQDCPKSERTKQAVSILRAKVGKNFESEIF